MERLTFDGNFCDIAQCTETRGGSFCEDGSCSQHKVWERLKEYESAGLTPREVHAYSDAEQNKRVVIFENQETLGRVADLICAEEQGRLVVLPCAVCQTVWLLVRGGIELWKVCSIKQRECGAWEMRLRNGMLSQKRPNEFEVCTRRFSSVGKTIFLTHQEAEKALEVQNG